jgi:hypothetical protein
VDVVIPASRSSVDALRRTATAAIQMRGRTRTILMGSSPEVAALAKELGCEYEEIQAEDWRATLNALLPNLSGSLLAIFEPSQIPHVDYLLTIAPWFSDTETAMVQVAMTRPQWSSLFGVGLNSRETPAGCVPNGLAIRDHWNAVPWLGTNALFRRSALVDAGGFLGGAPWQTSARLQAAGWRTRYSDLALCLSLEEQETMLVPPVSTGGGQLRQCLLLDLTLVQRVVLWGDHLAFAPSVMGALYLLAPLLAIWFSWSPVRRPDLLTLCFWTMVLGPSALGLILIDRHAPDLNRVMRWSRGVVFRRLRGLGQGSSASPSWQFRVAPTALLAALLWGGVTWVAMGIVYGCYADRFSHLLLALWAAGAAICAWLLLRHHIDRIHLVTRCREPLTIAGECRLMANEAETLLSADWGEHIECVIRDVGGQGIGVLAYQELEMGEHYLVSFEGAGTKISARTTVVYGEPGGGESEHRYYLRPAKEDRPTLARYARRVEEERLREQAPELVKRARRMVRRTAKRRSPRFAAELAVQIDGADGGRVDGSTINVSATGVALRGSRPAALDSLVLLRLLHPSLPRPLQARVVRVVQEGEQMWEMGLDLLRPNAALAQIAAPLDAPLFLEPWDEDHNAISRRGLANGEAVDSDDGEQSPGEDAAAQAEPAEEARDDTEGGSQVPSGGNEQPPTANPMTGAEVAAAEGVEGTTAEATDSATADPAEAPAAATSTATTDTEPEQGENAEDDAPQKGATDSGVEVDEFLPPAQRSHAPDAAIGEALASGAGSDDLSEIDQVNARLARLDASEAGQLAGGTIEDTQLDELLDELQGSLLEEPPAEQPVAREGDA